MKNEAHLSFSLRSARHDHDDLVVISERKAMANNLEQRNRLKRLG